jgi:lipocalin-like protein
VTGGFRDRLRGTWHMTEWYNETPAGERIHPLGPDATGLITYTADDHVMVHISAPNRSPYAVNDPFGGTASEDQAAIRSTIAYCGTYTLDGNCVVHHVAHATCPNWIGSQQRRHVAFAGDNVLTLSAPGALFQGKTVTAFVHWTRAAARAA